VGISDLMGEKEIWCEILLRDVIIVTTQVGVKGALALLKM